MLKPLESIRKKGYQHLKIATVAFENFVSNLKSFKGNMSTGESEEYHKTHLMDFFKNTYFSPNYLVAQKGDIDFVIHSSADSQSAAVVLFEVKSTTNKSEMITTDNLNKKAMQEILLYYLRERVGGNNLELKYLVITNTEEFFIFDAHEFERLFYNNTKLRRDFQEFAEGQKSGKNTDFFYQNIAKKYIEEIKDNIEYVHFNIKDYTKLLDKDDAKSRNKLSVLYKIFSPNYLLKQSVQQDHNSLNKNFYNELLYIIGLEEVVDENKKRVIRRLEESSRNYGSIIENTITKLDADESLSKIHNLSKYGVNREEQLFNVALELSITWINRILFLKLLEAQLIRYNGGDVNQGFLNPQKVRNYDELYELFFQVLAVKYENRKITSDVPYLNSSLFEISKLEHNTIKPSNLNNDLPIKIPSSTVLKDKKGKLQYKELPTLEYLLRFLDAYDFDSESERDIQDSNRALISASVLGLIFEKINSYKDGAIFTPSFVTMYMCRESIVKVVVDKFNAHYGWNCTSINDLYNSIDHGKIIEANDIINSITICDPAVGSGHFLVSALNEIIRIKYELHILADSEGKLLKGYDFDIINDELIITDDEGNIFTYNKSKESQRIQETIFKEKQKIIENCLFGVDINPNSVNICRLRLWIELLKNTYYTKESGYQHLETLPNIDINIKCGNSLLSKYNLDVDIQSVLSTAGKDAKEYRSAVLGYKTAPSKEKKREFDQIIDSIKQTISTGLLLSQLRSSNTYINLSKKQKELYKYILKRDELKFSEKQEPIEEPKKIIKLRADIEKLQFEYDNLRTTKTYKNSFEWRFEFPEVWNDNGDFIGFDLVVGNPPYVDVKSLDNSDVKEYFRNYTTTTNRINLYSIFIEKGYSLIKETGVLCYINPNSMLVNSSYKKLRELIVNDIVAIIKLPDNVFDVATVETIIFLLTKGCNCEFVKAKHFASTDRTDLKGIDYSLFERAIWKKDEDVRFNIFTDIETISLLLKLDTKGSKLIKFTDFSLGITPYDKAKGHSQEFIKSKGFHALERLSNEYVPLIKGANIFKYVVMGQSDEYLKYSEQLGAPRQQRFFTDEKVIVRQILSTNPLSMVVAYSDQDHYFTQIGFSIISNDKNVLATKMLLSLLNSKLINFYHNAKYLDSEKITYPKILIESCKNFPIVVPNDQQPYIDRVNKILDQKRENPQADTSAIEAEIDQMVYTLYNLTEGEINLIESTSKQWHKAN